MPPVSTISLSPIVLDPLLENGLREDIGRGDRVTDSLFAIDVPIGNARWIAKAKGVVVGLSVAARVFSLLDDRACFQPQIEEGSRCEPGETIATISAPQNVLLTGERVALNLAMKLSGIATLTREYVDRIADLPTQLTDTRKTTPGLRILEKYATRMGGAINHRFGLDDAAMIKDNHIVAAGGIKNAIDRVRSQLPYPLSIEVETTNLEEVKAAIAGGADIVMLDNMAVETMREAVTWIREQSDRVKIEASGNITLDNLRTIAETGVDYISTSAPITRSTWLDLSMRID